MTAANTIPTSALAFETPQIRTDLEAKISRALVHFGFIGAIILQRFGPWQDATYVFISLPIMLAISAFMLLSGLGKIRALPTVFYAIFIAFACLSTSMALSFPDTRVTISIASFVLVMMTYASFCVGPTSRFDRSKTFEIFLFYARICAVLGITQYLIQYVGVKWFTFGEMFPALKPILIEQFWNDSPFISWGSPYNRSNGFFLLEPSIMSQLMVIAILVEFFVKRKLIFIPLYAVAHVMTYAGTGLLALAIALPIVAIVSVRSIPRMLTFGAMALVLVLFVFLAFPQEVYGLLSRGDELGQSGSSGYARYVASWSVLEELSSDGRSVLGYGPGATQRSIYFVHGTTSPLYKLFVDYGYIGTISIFGVIISSFWRKDIAVLSTYFVVLYQFGGGYVTVMPILSIMLILAVWSAPQPLPSFRWTKGLGRGAVYAARP